MVAFKHSLSAWGQEELRSVIRRRVERFANGVRELQELTYGDRQTVGHRAVAGDSFNRGKEGVE